MPVLQLMIPPENMKSPCCKDFPLYQYFSSNLVEAEGVAPSSEDTVPAVSTGLSLACTFARKRPEGPG